MKSAALKFVNIFKEYYDDLSQSISILCGQGDNGSDGLAIARLLTEHSYQNITIYLIKFSSDESGNYRKNLMQLQSTNSKIVLVSHPNQFENILTDLVIDAVLGADESEPFEGKYVVFADLVNNLKKPVIAVDVPTGFPTEGLIDEPYKGIKADLVISPYGPKINFFFPESTLAFQRFSTNNAKDFKLADNERGDWGLVTEASVKGLIQHRKPFTHKGTYGHALIVAGNTNTMGAALLAANGCLNVGAGLTTVCLPESGLTALNTALPEVMALIRTEELKIEAFEKYTAIAIGPGLGLAYENEMLFEEIMKLKRPLVIDADALSILATSSDLIDHLPEQSILTPHLKEFDRLFGEHSTWWARVMTAKAQAKARNIVIVLKNQYTFICLPDGKVHINQSGNAGMASGGMGDVLTGIIVGLLAQSYTSAEAAKLGVYIHGKAGDELGVKRFTVRASQIAAQIPKTVKKLSVK